MSGIKLRAFLFVFFTLIVNCTNWAQDPFHFVYDDERGLPSNEVYSIEQDNKGFIWIGCDAGLFRYDGIRYQAFESADQLSNAKTGLVFSSSGKLYCYSFKNQLFYVENDCLKELKHPYISITKLTPDKRGNIAVSHIHGVSLYNEKSKKWKDITYYKTGTEPISGQKTDRQIKIHKAPLENYIFANYYSISEWNGEHYSEFKTEFHKKHSPVTYVFYANKFWIISLQQGTVFNVENNQITPYLEPRLQAVLKNRKITGVRVLSDHNLWIFTYQGAIQYNQYTKEVKLFYEHYAISDGLIDQEGNVWFTTLQSGLIRVPNLNYIVWNREANILENERINKLATDGNQLFFGAVNGGVYKLNLRSKSINLVYDGIQADIQSFNYEPGKQRLFFNINNQLFTYKNNTLTPQSAPVPAIKSLLCWNSGWLYGSSHGLFFQFDQQAIERIDSSWIYEIAHDLHSNRVWLATNNGILHLKWDKNRPKLIGHFFTNRQFKSIDIDPKSGNVYTVSFDGQIFELTPDHKISKLFDWDKGQCNKIRYRNLKLYLGTNKGLGIFNLRNKELKWIDNQSGLASNNIMDILLTEDHIWLGTGKGLQRIPIHTASEKHQAKLYINTIWVNKNKWKNRQSIDLRENQSLKLGLTTIHYKSNGAFQYAFSLNNEEWDFLPGSARTIPFDNIPAGYFNLRLKVVDQYNQDLSDVKTLHGYVTPKFYKSWWFGALCIVFFVLITYFFFRYQIRKSRLKAQRENELNLSKLTAIQSQMNPHFLFNSLNSIQDLVLKGDVENSYTYITKFANLVRKTLNYSEQEFISIDKEIDLLKIYLTLEQLRFKDQFTYEIISDNLPDGIKIPPLIIQPFVENALVHGLLHKDGDKHLQINFHFTDLLECIIEDNGIGREKSKLINQRQRKDHESFASKAMKKRFELLKHLMEGDFGYEFEDLSSKGKITGTKVHLRIPIQHEY